MSDPVLEAIKLLRNEVGLLSSRFGSFADAQLELQRETVLRLNRIDASLVDLKRRVDTAMLILVEIGQQQNISRERMIELANRTGMNSVIFDARLSVLEGGAGGSG